MTTNFLTVENISVGFGVSITSSDKAKAKSSDAKRFAKKARGAYSLALAFPEGVKLFSAPAGRKMSKIVIPAIAAFAKLTEQHENPSHAWIIKLPDDMACLQILANRSPYSDEVMPLNEITSALTNKHSELQLDGGFIIHATPDAINDFDGHFYDAHPLSVEDLVKASAISALKMQALSDYTLSIILGLCTVSVFGYMAYDYWDNAQQQEALARIQTIAPVDTGKEYEANIKELLASAGFSGADATNLLDKVFHDTDTSREGWLMNSIACSPIQCTERWRNQNGTHGSLQKAFGEKVTFDASQRDAIHIQDVSGKTSPISLDTLTSYTIVEAKLLEIVEIINQITPATLTITPAKLYGLTKNQKAEQIPSNKQIRQGTFSISGPLAIAKELTKQLPANVAVKSMSVEKIQSDTDPVFTVQGEYFVK